MTLRVLHLDHTSVAGGAELALLRTLQASHSWSAEVSVPPSAGAAIYAPLGARVRVRGVTQRAGVSGAGVLKTIPALARLLVQALATRIDPAFRKADLVDANTARAAAYGAIAANTSRVPFVVHVRDLVNTESLGKFGHALMTRLVLPRADGVIANSRATLASAQPYLRANTVANVIPSPFGYGTSQTPTVRAAGRDSGPLRIGMLARVDPWKGQLILLDAFAAAFGHSDVVLELAGAPLFGHEDFLAELRTHAADLGVADRVAFLGHVEPQDVLPRWDIAVQASTRPEPLGQNVLQYLAAGRAVAVAGEGGPTEWVVDGVNGLRFTPRDADSLARVLRRLVDDPDLRTRLSAAAVETPGLLTDSEVAEAHTAFYQEVLRRRR